MELRRTAREPSSLTAECRLGAHAFSARLADLSELGCFVATEEPAREGDEVVLWVQPPGADAKRCVRGRVVRTAGRRDDHIGFAVEFDGPLSEAAAEADA